MLGMIGLLLACGDAQYVVESEGAIDDLEALDSFDEDNLNAASEVLDNKIEGEFDWFNHPDRFEEDFEYTYTALPLGGKISKTPWSGDYWAKNKGGISYRWQTGEKFDYTQYDFDQLKNMSVEEIALLSPAEKYDLYVGNYEYSLNSRAMSEGSLAEPSWSGYCHGWAPASDRFEEPEPITLTNPDGIEIPFGSSDIKALLTYFEAEVVRSSFVGHDWSAKTYGLGSLCTSGYILDPACHDTNPATFHLVLANRIGIQDIGFNMDVDKGYEKWNQPVYAYRSKLLTTRPPSPQSIEETVVEYILETEVHWAMEIHPTWETVLFTEQQSSASKTYTYSIEVDKDGLIIGGQWLTSTQQGDYVNIQQVWNDFATLDANDDGRPDLTDAEVNQQTWQYFEIPDYLWYQEEISLAYDFEALSGMYALLGNTSTSKDSLRGYFGALQDLVQ